VTAIWAAIAALAYAAGLTRARQKGILDFSTGY